MPRPPAPSDPKAMPWPPLRAGDLIGFSSFSIAGAAINLGTWGIPFWDLSHVAIVVPHPFVPGSLALCESTSECDEDCLVAGCRVSGVQWHEVGPRVTAYLGRAWLYRLRRQTDKQPQRLAVYCNDCGGLSYDAIGAWRARDLPLSWIERRLGWWPENLHALFCSELAAAAWRAAGLWDPPDASAWSPNRLCRTAVDTGLCGRPLRLYREGAPPTRVPRDNPQPLTPDP